MSTPTRPLPAKACSVTRQGAPDGFVPPTHYSADVLEGGHTRLAVSGPAFRIERAHQALVAALQPPLKLLYIQLTDRQTGQLPKPIQRVAVELPRDRVMAALKAYRRLIYHDGRHQLWVRGNSGEQVVLEEIGMLFVYPDDFQFRDILEDNGIPEGTGETIATRDFVRVEFLADADAEEQSLISDLNLISWEG
jgi:hypothetical protein